MCVPQEEGGREGRKESLELPENLCKFEKHNMQVQLGNKMAENYVILCLPVKICSQTGPCGPEVVFSP